MNNKTVSARLMVVVSQLRKLADEIENGYGVSIGDFDTSVSMTDYSITHRLSLCVNYAPTGENISKAYGQDIPTTLED